MAARGRAPRRRRADHRADDPERDETWGGRPVRPRGTRPASARTSASTTRLLRLPLRRVHDPRGGAPGSATGRGCTSRLRARDRPDDRHALRRPRRADPSRALRARVPVRSPSAERNPDTPGRPPFPCNPLSPLPYSNRRPLPYHGSLPELRELAVRAKVTAQLSKPLSRRGGQRSAPSHPPLPTGCPGDLPTPANEASRRSSRHGVVGGRGSPASRPDREPWELAVLLPELLRLDGRRHVRVVGVHVLDRLLDRVDARVSTSRRDRTSPADVRWSSGEPSGHRYEAWIECARSRERAASRRLCAGRPDYVERRTACAAK